VVKSWVHDLFSLPFVHVHSVADRDEEVYHGRDVALLKCLPKFLEALGAAGNSQFVMRKQTREQHGILSL